MSVLDRCEKFLEEVQNHLRDELLPFWLTHGVDKEYGGYLTYLDRNGNPTGETVKTHLCQTRCIYTYSSIHRAGIGQGEFLKIAKQGVDFVLNKFWDDEYAGWYWTAQQDGTPLNISKLTYGHSFAIYALSEYGMASGDPRGVEWAVKTYEMLQTLAADNCHGGYYEFLERESHGLARERSVALAQEAYQWLLGVPGLDARLAVLDEKIPHALAHLSELEREEVIVNLLDLARTDHGVTAAEQRVRDRVRALLR